MTEPPSWPSFARRCGGLDDPTRTFTILLLAVGGVHVAYHVLRTGTATSEGESSALLVALRLTVIAVPVAFLFAVAGMLRVVLRPRILLLRSFRRDHEDATVQSALRAAMGRGFRICGIRPPRARASLVSRILLFGSEGLRYLGSDRLDLEARDHNWLARLLVTASRSPMVVFDIRRRTTNIDDELRVLVTGLGLDRCIFVVAREDDRSQTPNALSTLIPGLNRAATLASTVVIGDKPRVEALRQMRSLRDTVMTDPRDRGHMAHAWSLVMERVGERNLSTSWVEREPVRSLVFFAATWLVYYLLALASGSAGIDNGWPATTVGIASFVLLYSACRRLRAIGRDVEPLSRQLGERWPTWLESTIARSTLLLAFLQLASTVLLPNVLGAAEAARHTLTQVRLVQLRDAISMFRLKAGRTPNVLEVEELAREIDPGASGATALRDPWGTQFHFEATPAGQFELRSAGVDRTLGTADDIVVEAAGSRRSQR